MHLNRIHDSVGKALRTANQGSRDCLLSCALIFVSSVLKITQYGVTAESFYHVFPWLVNEGLNDQRRDHISQFSAIGGQK